MLRFLLPPAALLLSFVAPFAFLSAAFAQPPSQDETLLLRSNAPSKERLLALQRWIEKGKPSKEAAETLRDLLRQEEPPFLENVIRALPRLGEQAEIAKAELLVFLQDDRPEIRLATLQTLHDLGWQTTEIAYATGYLLKDRDAAIRRLSLRLLSTMKLWLGPSIPALVYALDDPADDIRLQAVALLGSLGPLAKGAIPALRDRLRGSPPPLQNAIRTALVQLSTTPSPSYTPPPTSRPASSPPPPAPSLSSAPALPLPSSLPAKTALPPTSLPSSQPSLPTSLPAPPLDLDAPLPAAPALNEVWRVRLLLLQTRVEDGLTKRLANSSLLQEPLLFPALLQLLQDPDLRVRARALLYLRPFGAKAAPAYRLLLRASALSSSKDSFEDRALFEHSFHRLFLSFGPAMTLPLADAFERSSSWRTQALIARTLRAFGSSMLPFLKDGLRSDEPALQIAVLRASSYLSPQAIPFLFDEIRAALEILSLTRLGASQEQQLFGSLEVLFLRARTASFPELFRMLVHPDETLQRLAIRSFVSVGPPSVDPLRFRLPHSSPLLALRILHTLGAIGSLASSSSDAILPFLSSPFVDLRRSALLALASFSDHGARLTPLLLPFLSSPLPSLRHAAAHAIASFGTSAKTAWPTLLSRLPLETSPSMQAALLRALGASDPSSPQLLPLLLPFLQEARPLLRSVALEILLPLGTSAKPALPLLLRLFPAETDPSIRLLLVQALASIGKEAQDGFPLLQTAFAKELRPKRRGVYLWAFGHLLHPDALPLLLTSVRSKNYVEHRQALLALQHFGPLAAPLTAPLLIQSLQANPPSRHLLLQTLASFKDAAFPHLAPLLASPKPEDRLDLLTILHASPSKKALPLLLRASKDPLWSIREKALPLLQTFAPSFPAALQAILDEISDPSLDVRLSALRSCYQLGPLALPALPTLLRLLKQGSPAERALAADTLGQLGSKARRRAIPALQAALQDPSTDVRLLAAASLAKLQSSKKTP